MNTLEKSMLFIPNRYSVHGKEMFVSFNIAVIPEDMEVLSMNLIVPVSAPATGKLHLREIQQGWDEQHIWTARPSCTEIKDFVLISGGMQGGFDVTRLSKPWRFGSIDNHGVYVSLESDDAASFLLEDPPYLLVSTI
ncbi:hypothetical protein [Paenibacillus sp. DYY-L-2]|uniref:hypothetical protein n=1 Tax=Paenibacillus sp. DYY-L-2 TaxID=3447013 RepID=UPI003F503008